MPLKHLVYKGKLRARAAAQLNTRDGRRAVTVTQVGSHSAVIDTNHPLAGRTRVCAIEIADVRDATAEELAHGHGPGGHQHEACGSCHASGRGEWQAYPNLQRLAARIDHLQHGIGGQLTTLDRSR